jgi:hypothetical protein
MRSDGRALRCAATWVEKLEFFFSYHVLLTVYNLVNKVILVHSFS